MHMCKKCSGVKKLVLGALLLVNAFVWPQWLGIDGWVAFVGLLMILGGFLMLVVPNKCPSCNVMASKPAKPAAKKGKK